MTEPAFKLFRAYYSPKQSNIRRFETPLGFSRKGKSNSWPTTRSAGRCPL